MQQIRERRLLLVEGRDEVNLFRALIRDCFDDDPGIQVIDAGGKGKFSRNLRAIQTAATAAPALQSIGVVRDADCRRSRRGNVTAACVDEYLKCLEERDATSSKNADKSFAHAYLAATEDPVARVGEGALQGVWDFASRAFAPLAQFLHQLALRPGGSPQASP